MAQVGVIINYIAKKYDPLKYEQVVSKTLLVGYFKEWALMG